MSQGTEKGRWWCDGKPAEANFHIHSQDDVLARIEAATSEFARANSGVTGPYDPTKSPVDYPNGMQRMPVYQENQSQQQAPQRQANEPQVDFEDIQDDWQYRLAQQLYYDRPDESIDIGRDSFMLFVDDRAVLRVTARQSVDIVDIETFRSDRGLDECWEEILDHAEY